MQWTCETLSLMNYKTELKLNFDFPLHKKMNFYLIFFLKSM